MFVAASSEEVVNDVLVLGFLHRSRSMRSMRGGFIFRSQGPSLKVHHGQYRTSMTKRPLAVILSERGPWSFLMVGAGQCVAQGVGD